MAKRSRSTSPEVSVAKLPARVGTSPTSSLSMRCFLPPHRPFTFNSQVEFETHYAKEHSNRCSECRHNLPTPHLLGLHIAENHDPIIAARRERGDKTFACLVDGCEKVCGDWKKRRMHLIDKHGFPRNYDFFIVNTGVDGKGSMLRPGVDAQGHRASSRERRDSSVSEDEATATPATSSSVASPTARGPTTAEQESMAPSPGATSIAQAHIAAPRVLGGKKRAASIRSIGAGGILATQLGRSGTDEITSSMSALKMVPRVVAEKQRAKQS
ncbi:hypothetical protein LTR95_011387 [Oleoguttula sp. CCFEE 5521]